MTTRSTRNPLIRPEDLSPSRPDMRVVGVFNPAAHHDGSRTVLVLRVAEQPVQEDDHVVVARFDEGGSGEVVMTRFARNDPELVLKDRRFFFHGRDVYYTSLSHLRLATSTDGGETFEIGERPWLAGADDLDSYGLEDPRISTIDGEHHVTYTAVSRGGAGTALASTSDFVEVVRRGLILLPTNKNCLLFPRRFGERYLMLHRPSGRGQFANNIWLAESPDLVSWGSHRPVVATRPSRWDSTRLGIGPQPVLTDEGWIALYYGVDEHRVYGIGAVLLDADRPWVVRARSEEPLMTPTADYEVEGFFPNVLFPSGLVDHNGRWQLYYGAGDRVVCSADLGTTADLLAAVGR